MADDRRWMGEALKEAEKALAEGELPIGAVIVGSRGDVLARSRAADLAAGNRSSHAEIRAIIGSNFKDSRTAGMTIYTTLEPCVMCAAAILIEGIERVVYSLEAPQDGGLFIFGDPHVRARCMGAREPETASGVMRTEAVALFSRYLQLVPERSPTAAFARSVVQANS